MYAASPPLSCKSGQQQSWIARLCDQLFDLLRDVHHLAGKGIFETKVPDLKVGMLNEERAVNSISE